MEAVELARPFRRRGRRGERPVRAEGVLDQHRLPLGVAVGQIVDLLLHRFSRDQESSLAEDRGHHFGLLGRSLHLHLGLKIQRVTDKPFLTRWEVCDPGVAGIDAAVEDGDRPLEEMQRGRVLEPETIQGISGVHPRVIDGELGPLDLPVHDRDQRGLLPRQREGSFDDVLEEFPGVCRLRGRGHPLLQPHRGGGRCHRR